MKIIFSLLAAFLMIAGLLLLGLILLTEPDNIIDGLRSIALAVVGLAAVVLSASLYIGMALEDIADNGSDLNEMLANRRKPQD